MPLYEYECDACGHRFEIIQKFSDGPPDACPKCGKGPVQRLQSSPAIQFKGTGWYITDYAGKGKSGSEQAAAATTRRRQRRRATRRRQRQERQRSRATRRRATPKQSDARATAAAASKSDCDRVTPARRRVRTD